MDRPQPEHVVLDACCLLNLCGSGEVESILRQLPYRFHVGERARAEAMWLRIDAGEGRDPVDLAPLLSARFLLEEHLGDEPETALFVEFAATVDDGEAEAIAIAGARGFSLASDDRKARRVFSGRFGEERIVGTPQLLRRWQKAARIGQAAMAMVLRRVSRRASYRPRPGDPDADWWERLVGS